MKYEIGTPVIIYMNKGLVGGGIGIVKDRDPSDPKKPAYLILDALDRTKTRWILEEYLFKLEFEKPSFWKKIKMLFFS